MNHTINNYNMRTIKTGIILYLISLCITSYAQQTSEVRDFYDAFSTKIRAIHQVTGTGQLHGLQKYYYKNGELQQTAEYKLNQKHGLLKSYFLGVELSEIYNYEDDIKDGKFEEYAYDDDGKYYKYRTGIYESGRLMSEETFHSNGRKESVYNYTGPTITWYPNGQKYAELNKIQDVTQGKFNAWYEDGTKLLESNYIDGLEDGEWRFYGNGGNVIRIEEWERGERAGKWKYYYTFEGNRVIQIENLAEATNYIEVDHSDISENPDTNRMNFKASGFLKDGTKLWDGSIIWSGVKVRDSDFNTWIQVGPMKYYDGGQLIAEGELVLIDANNSKIRSDRHGEWKYYENNELYYLEKYAQGTVINGQEMKN